MPELPEVETMVRGLRPEVEGRTILETEFCPCERKPIQLSPASATFRRRSSGQKVVRVWRLAKRIMIDLDSGDTIVVEPRMTGLMLVSDPPTTEHRRICWHLKRRRGSRSSFEFWDRRGLGTVRLLSESQVGELQNRFGPDALEISAEQWRGRAGKSRRAIKVAMLDQTLVAGIGNLYASEILHLAGVSPKRACHRLTVKQWARITDATHEILQEAIRYEGSTLGDGTYRNALNQDGGYQNKHRVYQKADEICTACSRGQIKRIVQSQRATFYCPKCQK